MSMDKFIKIFRDFIPQDKGRIKELIPLFHEEMKLMGEYIEQKKEQLFALSNERMDEFIDFIDGNGFIIKHSTPSTFSFLPHSITIIPIYPEEIEDIYEEEEQQSAVSEYVSVQETVLSYTSMENDERYILEYSQLSTPRPIWICLHRCLEFLRLVSAGWCGSSTLPRPP